jgi:hypothetical protein
VDVFYGERRECCGSGELAAEEPGESGFQLFLGKELLRPGRGRRRVVIYLTIEQKLGCVDEHLGGRFAGVDSNELEARALLVVEINVHGVKAMLAGYRAVN